jgi:hypothetical protein
MLRAIGKDGALQHRFRAVDVDDAVTDFNGIDQGSQVSLPERDVTRADVLAHKRTETNDPVGAESAGRRWHSMHCCLRHSLLKTTVNQSGWLSCKPIGSDRLATGHEIGGVD